MSIYYISIFYVILIILGVPFHSPGLKDNLYSHPISKRKKSGKTDREVKRRHK